VQDRIADSPDVLFFVAVHQVSELWFKVIIHELELTRSAITVDDLDEAAYHLERVASIGNALVEQVATLGTLSPARFAVIRSCLGTASGYQSAQFRQLEFLSGLKDPGYLELHGITEAERSELARRLAEPSVLDAFEALCARRGAHDLAAIARNDDDHALTRLVERLLDYDESIARWRARHALMVERIMGYRTGTGGSAGADYLYSTTRKRFFPRLWQTRSRL